MSNWFSFQKIKKDILRFLGNNFVHIAVSVLCNTLRISELNKNIIRELEKNQTKYILAFWHGTMLLPWFLMRNKNFSALVSKSSDGEILSRLLTKWKYDVSRGSSSKGGKEAMDEIIMKVSSGNSLAITPDGPRGPRLKMKAGAVVAAKKTAVPLVLVGISFNKKIILKSWDLFEIPKPFSKAVAVYSEPFIIQQSSTYEETDEFVKKSEEILNNLQLEAQKYC
jgi:lysophospholipid acyltransferase (LPLAT)-like uncharacterized protein